MKLATVRVGSKLLYGSIGPNGFADLSRDFPRWETLRGVIADDGLDQLKTAYAGSAVTHTDFTYEIPIPDAEKIICVGVNFPDRNAEYKDGQDAPPNMSLFPRFARSFVGHGTPLTRPPESEKLDYEGGVLSLSFSS